MNRTSGICGTVTKDVTVISSKFQTARRKTIGLKNHPKKYSGPSLPVEDLF